ncbi:MAG TPA: hypothetical protein VGH89_31740 [Pseudonocardia sp.]
MTDWAYEMRVPNDVVGEDELDSYRQLAIATWRTAAEATGAMPGEPTAELVTVDPAGSRPDPVTGEIPRRAWVVRGSVS